MKKNITLSYKTMEKDADERLDFVTAREFTEFSRVHIQRWIKDGKLLLDGEIVKPKQLLKVNQLISVETSEEPTLDDGPEDIPIEIIYEDEDIVVLNKQPGLVVHPGAGNLTGTLVNALLHHDEELSFLPRAGIVHRLDKDTTGCIVIAKSQTALVKLQIQIQKRIASRNYLAVVHGVPKSDAGTIVGAIGRHPKDRKKYAVVSHEKGRHASTHWQLVERLNEYSLMSFKLDTGRTHQIRVHCAHIGHPIVGDPTYSRCRKLPINLSGQTLHAIRLGLDHPITNLRMEFEAPLPDCFKKLLEILRKRKRASSD